MRIKAVQLDHKFDSDPLEELISKASRFTPLALPHQLGVTRRIYNRVLKKRQLKESFSVSLDKRLGVIIPCRDREKHLQKLLPELTEKLEKQGVEYQIAIIEQDHGKLFNLGAMRNIGATILKDSVDYFCFHDVDNIPIDADYGCPTQPLRLVSRWFDTDRDFDVFNNSDGYVYFSGVVSITRGQYQAVNGYSGGYWGWGVEDDDFHLRCLLNGLIPFKDSDGVFVDLANPGSEAKHREDSIVLKNRKRFKNAKKLGWIGMSGVRQTRFRLIKKLQQGERITRYLVSL